MKNLSLPVESVQERDIDFLLVEEFIASKEFFKFVTSTLELPPCDAVLNVQRSINDFGLGETDVLVEYAHDNLRVGVLIENKLDAIFQPAQAERYVSRAKKYVSQHRFDVTYEVLIAPSQYIDRQNDFSRTLSYEQLIKYFKTANLGTRGEFKATLLTIATEKLRRGYIAINSEPNQAFWQNYYHHLATHLPHVYMKPVTIVPAKSDWIDLSASGYKFVHKLKRGQIDFSSLNEAELRRLEENFKNRAERVTFASGPVLRISTVPLDRMSDFSLQISDVERCIDDISAAICLLINNS